MLLILICGPQSVLLYIVFDMFFFEW